MDQWSQIFNKLNLALEKLSSFDSDQGLLQSSDPDILENPQYINQQGQSLNRPKDQNLTNLVVNVVEYDDDHDIDYKDYFQAIVDTDNISLDEIEDEPSNEPLKDYIDLYDDLVDKLFDVNAPAQESSGLPGVGNKNPSPLTDFPSDETVDDQALPDIGKYPVHLPIPLREAEKIGVRFRPHKDTKRPVNIGSSRPAANDRVGGKTKLTAPSIIRLIFGPPTNMSEVRVSIPDFTSSGPVNIPSSLQLYGDIGKYINETMDDIPVMAQTSVPYHKDILEPEISPYQAPLDPPFSHYDTPSYAATFNGYPVSNDYAAKHTYETPRNEYTKKPSEARVNTSFLAALVNLLEEKERKKIQRPSVQIPMTDRPNFSIKLPTQSALPKPQSLAALEARGRPAQPVPIEWLKDRPLPTQRLPPYHEEILQRSSASVPDQSNMDSILRRFSQSPFDSKVHRFKSPPIMLPINTNGAASVTQNPFTILNPQSIPGSLRIRRQRRQTFVLETPDSLKDFVSDPDDAQLHPSQAVQSILQNRPEVEVTTEVSTSTTSSLHTTRKQTILSKPSAIADTELVAAQPQLFVNSGAGSGVQTSLLGFPNPFISTSSSGSISYNKLMIAAALSIVPTLAIAMPFLAPSVGKKKRRRK